MRFPAPRNEPQNTPLRSIHTTSFSQILNQLSISLIVSTYQASKLIVIRADGDVINTHFRFFDKPMGLAVDRNRMAIGTTNQIVELRNVPAIIDKLEPKGKHDACYLPRQCHITGDIDIHEMGWGIEELWFVNTRFSCLCTLDLSYSFVPRWRPNFVTALSPEDRCHLNGLGMVNHQPKFVTALATSDTLSGWRENKARGGLIIDIETHQQIAKHLSMPHSPRWHNNRLWLLESGNGSLVTVDLKSGQLNTVAILPGFTRGLDFYDRLAFIGLSQVRESSIFGGIPITKRLEKPSCGVWIVNIETGEIIAYLEFEDAVQEIFSVQVLPGICFPEIIDWDDPLVGSSYILPDEALKDVPPTQRRIIGNTI